MKINIAALLFFLLAPFFTFGQTVKLEQKARQSLDQYQQLYQFDAQQKEQVLDLQLEYFTKEAQLFELKSTNYERYLTKRAHLKSVKNRSMYRLLNDRQQKIYLREQKKQAEQAAALKARLKKEGADAATIKKALLELE